MDNSSLRKICKCLGIQYNLILNENQARSHRIWLFVITKRPTQMDRSLLDYNLPATASNNSWILA